VKGEHMRRVVYIPDDIGNNRKYVIKEEYKKYGVYEEISPSGYRVHQSWLILTTEEHKIQIRSFMNLCYEEVLDYIDLNERTGKFELRAFLRNGVFVVHKNGDMRI
jgi:hypothetical protein